MTNIWCEHCRDHYATSHYVARGGFHGVGRQFGPTGELLAAAEAVERIIKLCEGKLAEAEGGGLTDIDTLWPSQVLDELGDLWTGQASWRD